MLYLTAELIRVHWAYGLHHLECLPHCQQQSQERVLLCPAAAISQAD